MRRALSAVPIAAQMPWPSEPVATSTNGSRGVGCPSRSESISRSFSSSARSNAPASAHAAYRIGAACPFDSTKRSLSVLLRILRDRTASRRKTARPRCRPSTAAGRMAAAGFRRRARSSRSAAGWRCSSSAGMSVARSMDGDGLAKLILVSDQVRTKRRRPVAPAALPPTGRRCADARRRAARRESVRHRAA